MALDPNIPLSVTPHRAPNMLQMLLAVEDMRQRQRYGQDAEEDRAVRRDELAFRHDQLTAARQAQLDEAEQKAEAGRQQAFVRAVTSLKTRPAEERAARYPAIIAEMRAANQLPSGPVPETWEQFGGDAGLEEFATKTLSDEQFGAAFGPQKPATKQPLMNLGGGYVFDPETRQVVREPPPEAQATGTGFTLNPDEVRYDAAGQEIARRPPGPVRAGTGRAARSWVTRGKEVVRVTDDEIRPGDVPFDPVAARQTAANAGQGEDSPYLEERRIRNRESVAALMKKAGYITTGVGSVLGALPGTSARNFQAELDTLKANISFGELAEMRASSRTGGALGAISVRELELLGATLGALDTGQSPAQFRSQLKKVQDSLDRWQEARTAAKGASGAATGKRTIGRFEVEVSP